MKVIISKKVSEKYPDFITGVIFASNVNNKGEAEKVMELIKEQEKFIRENFNLGELAEKVFVSNWRKVYSSFGAKPSSYLASSEALIRRILKGNVIPHINKIVDIYNYISLKYKTPVGAEDFDKLEGDLVLKFAEGGEKFIPLGSNEEQPPKNGEVVYADDKEIVCRRWNWRESDKTKLREETKRFVLVVDAMMPINKKVVETALEETKKLLEEHCEAKCVSKILSKDDREFEIE